jgi:uncharacterized DUF497 family protein
MGGAVVGFDWDDGNRAKCRKHGVALDEIEAALRGPVRVFPDPAHSAVETRYLGIGMTAAGRHLLIAFTRRAIAGQPFIRPISARFYARQGDAA